MDVTALLFLAGKIIRKAWFSCKRLRERGVPLRQRQPQRCSELPPHCSALQRCQGEREADTSLGHHTVSVLFHTLVQSSLDFSFIAVSQPTSSTPLCGVRVRE